MQWIWMPEVVIVNLRKRTGKRRVNSVKKVIREHLIDCSDTEKFVFNLICPECGKVWQSTPVSFSKAGEEPQT